MNLTNEKLYALCKKYGSNAKFWRQKFMGLLPEVYQRKLYEQKGFRSIFEFAAKLAGLSQEQVRRILKIEEKFKDKPVLHELLVEGAVSIHKLARVASVATQENQEIIAQQVQILPQKALETLVRDERRSVSIVSEEKLKSSENLESKNENQSGLFKTIIERKSVRTHTFSTENALNLSEEVLQKLLKLQQKGIDINQLILEILAKREFEIAQEKEEIGAEMTKTQHQQTRVATGEKTENGRLEKKPSRYIPVRIKKILQKEYGNKCSIATCRKSATTIHHAQRFALSNLHDPHYLAPLCFEHHTIAHSIDVKFQEIRQKVVQRA